METANTLKFWHLYTNLHIIITQKTDMFISTNMSTSKLESSDLVCLQFNLVKPTFENVNVKIVNEKYNTFTNTAFVFTFRCCFCCSVKHSCQVRCEKNSLKILLFSHKPCGSCKRTPSMWNSSTWVDSCDSSDSTEDPSEDMVEYSSSIFETAHETE